MEIQRAYRYLLYPTDEQAEFLNQNFGCVRFVWNQLVANFNSWTPEFTPPKLNEKILKDNPEFPWLKEAISYALQQKTRDFEQTKSQFFNKKRKTKLGRMQFRKRGVSRDSFRIPGSVLPKCNLDMCSTGLIQLPKMAPMKVIIDRPFSGELRSVTVSKNKANQYFVSVLVLEEVELKQNTGRSIGIDLGLKDLAILSNGMRIENPRFLRKSQSKVKKANRCLSRKVRGSNRYLKQKQKLARLHLKIANQRVFVHHNLSTWLTDQFDTIIMEDLAVRNMVKNRKLAKSIADASWSSLVSMIRYKSNWYGRTFHQIDRFAPSTKTCSSCGHKLDGIGLDVREWTCPSCGSVHDRDLNAAQNILDTGLREVYDLSSDELAEYRRRELVRPEVAMPKADSMKRLVSFI